MYKLIFLFFACISVAYFSGKRNVAEKKTMPFDNPSKGKINTTGHATASTKPIDLNNYTLVMNEGFEGIALDTKRWQYYEENTVRHFGKVLRSNVVVSNGTLKLYAKRTTDGAGNESFSSGMLSTQFSLNQKYGYFELRAKVNSQVGPQSSFWLLQHSVGVVNEMPNPSVYGAEIDIFEYHCAAGTEYLYPALHWNGYDFSNGSHRTISGNVYIPGISKGFHIFGFEWTPKEYILYVDGIEKARTDTAISHVPEFIILSTEITGFGGDRFKMNSSVPDVFEVDYLKVYARKPAVTIYGDCDYYGLVSLDLKPGVYTSAQLLKLGVANNEASSIEIPKGWVATAYDGDNCTGNSQVFTGDNKCMAGFNDKLSSVKITDH